VVRRARVDAFYAENAPEKAGEVGALLAKNRGNEATLLKRLAKK
jgi:hypothetical protein